MGWAAFRTLSGLYPQASDKKALKDFFDEFVTMFQSTFKTDSKPPCGWGSRVAWAFLWDRKGDGSDAGAHCLGKVR